MNGGGVDRSDGAEEMSMSNSMFQPRMNASYNTHRTHTKIVEGEPPANLAAAAERASAPKLETEIMSPKVSFQKQKKISTSGDGKKERKGG